MTSNVWKYFTKFAPNEAQCNLCLKLLKTGGGTSNLRQHLKVKHFIHDNEQANESFNYNHMEVEIKEPDNNSIASIEDNGRMYSPIDPIEKRIKKRIKTTVSVDNHPFKRAIQGMITPADEFQIFGDYVASELRSLISADNRRKLKLAIQRAILNISENDAIESSTQSCTSCTHSTPKQEPISLYVEGFSQEKKKVEAVIINKQE